jgi:hypothetical protein
LAHRIAIGDISQANYTVSWVDRLPRLPGSSGDKGSGRKAVLATGITGPFGQALAVPILGGIRLLLNLLHGD